jgi:hypothetical protein
MRVVVAQCITGRRARVKLEPEEWNEGNEMKIKATLQIQGKADVAKVVEGEDGQTIWNLLILEVAELFPEYDKNKITLEKKVPDPVFIARSEEGEVLCQVRCEPI